MIYLRGSEIRKRKVVPPKLRNSTSNSSRPRTKKKEKKFDFRVYQNNGVRIFWKFLGNILTDPEHENIIRWTGKDLEFTIFDETKLARLWSDIKKKPKMHPLHFTRALRDHYLKNIKKPLEQVSIPIIKKAIAERTYEFETSFELCSLLNCTVVQLKEYAKLVGRWWFRGIPASERKHSLLETIEGTLGNTSQSDVCQPPTSASHKEAEELASQGNPDIYTREVPIGLSSQASGSQQSSSTGKINTTLDQDDVEFQMSLASGISFLDQASSQSNSPLSPVTNLTNLMDKHL